MSLIGQDPKGKIVERFARHVSSGKAEFFSEVGVDFVFGKREGVYVWDAAGERRLIDCHCNGGVFNLGHRHPRVIAALRQALDELDIGNHHFISEHRARLAERLTALCPGDLKRVVFGVSGGEAVDTAIKLARGHTRRPKVISAHEAITGTPAWRWRPATSNTASRSSHCRPVLSRCPLAILPRWKRRWITTPLR